MHENPMILLKNKKTFSSWPIQFVHDFRVQGNEGQSHSPYISFQSTHACCACGNLHTEGCPKLNEPHTSEIYDEWIVPKDMVFFKNSHVVGNI